MSVSKQRLPTIQWHDSPLNKLSKLVGSLVVLYQVVYMSLMRLFQHYPKVLGSWLPPPSSEFCPNQDTECTRYDLAAFQFVSTMAFYTCGILAIYNLRNDTNAYQHPEDRLFGYPHNRYSKVVGYLTAVNLAYQIWDFFVSWTIPEHCTTVMMLHHIVAATACASSLRYHLLGPYSHLFLGCSEISSMLLVWLDLTRYFVPVPGSLLEQAMHNGAAPLFAILFTYFRVIRWWPMAWNMYKDIQMFQSTATYKKDDSSTSPKVTSTQSVYVSLIFLSILTVPMGLLQLYWLGLIAHEATKILAPPAGAVA
jgi:hypothetical protein